ncbi:MAG: cytochrome c [Chthoniobacteraceae bacterium]
MKMPIYRISSAIAVATLAVLCLSASAEEIEKPIVLKPVASTGSGLLLEPPVDLSKFTHADFVKVSSTAGPEKLNKAWITATVPLPPHSRADVKGLTRAEIEDYMLQARRLFDSGGAVPISDVGLISTQEDVIRRPMLNHVSGFSNAVANVYLLVQKPAEADRWGYFSIVQDLTTDPPTDYFAEIKGEEVKMEAVSCYKCHASGPLAIHPAREDFINDPGLLRAFNEHIADQPIPVMDYPEHDPAPAYGEPLKLKACAKCHAEDKDRAPLFKAHAHSIRVLVDFGYMPPKGKLKPAALAELKAWLESKP